MKKWAARCVHFSANDFFVNKKPFIMESLTSVMSLLVKKKTTGTLIYRTVLEGYTGTGVRFPRDYCLTFVVVDPETEVFFSFKILVEI